ncbi:MAG TPA: secondary thiamine-phosphate synthase enzyme YjbQ [Anaerolineales bacterium]|nr:secondary thiamine-phosphate synthase enzyme YjbQ [Anaerolineales bacterium]
MIQTREIELSTRGHADIRDLTAGIERLVADSGIRDGLVSIFTPSATSGLTTIEFEDGALDDLRATLDRLVPPDAEYRHNLRWGDGNGHAHIRAALLGPSLCVPVQEGRIRLGTWQQIVFVDFDVRPRRRKVVVQILGDPAEAKPPGAAGIAGDG